MRNRSKQVHNLQKDTRTITRSLFRKGKTSNSFSHAVYNSFLLNKDDDMKKIFSSKSNDCNGSENT